MLSTDVEARLGEIELIKDIQGAAGFADLRGKDGLKVPRQLPAVFVVPLREDPQDDLQTIGAPVLQKVVYHIAIITVVRVPNDLRRDRTNALMDQVRQAIKGKLYGWVPPGFDEPFIRGKSALFEFEDGAHWHQDEFITDRYEEPTSV